MKYRVEVSDCAEGDLLDAFEWIALHSVSRAGAWLVGIRKAFESLQAFPERCGLAPEAETLGTPLRQLLYGRRGGVYRILFTVEGKKVYILHVRHGAREPVASEDETGE